MCPDINMNRSRTCFAWSSFLTKAFTVISWLKGLRHSLNVASMYQDLARARNSSCWSVAKTRCLRLRTLRSARRNSDGIWSVASSNSKSCGSLGLSLWRRWLAALAMFSGLGKLGHGTSSRSSNRTSSTMADAGLKTSATALALTLEVIFAADAAPTSAGWLCALDPSSYTPLPRSMTLTLHGLT